jgi:hypothetical protein
LAHRSATLVIRPAHRSASGCDDVAVSIVGAKT